MSICALPDSRFYQNTKRELPCKSVLEFGNLLLVPTQGSLLIQHSSFPGLSFCPCKHSISVCISKGDSSCILTIRIKLCVRSKENLFSLHFEVVWLWGLLNKSIYSKIQHLTGKAVTSILPKLEYERTATIQLTYRPCTMVWKTF